MSLKSKIEAVIYASEEPVTLAQLIGLLSEEAQAELDAAAAELAARQAELALEEDADDPAPDATGTMDQDGLNAEVLDSPEEAEASEEAAAAEAEAAGEEPVQAEAEGPAAAEASEPAEAVEGEAAEAAAAVVPEAPAEEPGAEPVAAEAAGVADVANAGRQPTPEEDEASAKAEARAKERELKNYLRAQVDELIGDYANSDRGIEIREVAGGFRFATKPEYHDAVRGFIKSLKPPMKLSLQALETLAVIAYKQPITAPEISEIRGVDSGGVVGSLIARKLVTTAGRKQVIGRPILYKTTKDFLVRFGLKDINELPSIEEFEKMAGELADMEPTQEEIPMTAAEMEESADAAEIREAAEAAEPMAGEHEAQADGVPDVDAETPAAEADAGSDIDADRKPEEHSEQPAEGAVAQADGGDPDENDDPEDEDDDSSDDPVEDTLVDGRLTGVGPAEHEELDPSGEEAEEQETEAGE